jgi:nicotinamidase-related amidase
MSELNRRTFLTDSAGTLAAVGAASLLAATPRIAEASPSDVGDSAQQTRPRTGHRAMTLANTALVLVDHQVGTIGWAGELAPGEGDQLKMWVRILARFAKGARMPVVLTSSLETEAQGPLLPEFQQILPQEYEARIKRTGVINAWDDPAFANAVRATGRRNLIMGGLTTDVCLVPPALSAKAEGFNVVAMLDISAATTRTAAATSKDILSANGIESIVVTPMITHLLGNYKNPASGAFFEAMQIEGGFAAFAKGNLR